jgi:hypothetical protein
MIQLCEPLWMDELRIRLEKIDLLEDGWNGEGSIAPTLHTIQEACLVVTLVQCGNCPLPYVSAGQEGEVELAWVGNGIRAEIEVSGRGIASAFLRRPGFSDIERSIDLATPDFRFVAAAITQLDPA